MIDLCQNRALFFFEYSFEKLNEVLKGRLSLAGSSYKQILDNMDHPSVQNYLKHFHEMRKPISWFLSLMNLCFNVCEAPDVSEMSPEEMIKGLNGARTLMTPNQPAELLKDLSLPEMLVLVSVKKIVIKNTKAIHFGDIKDELNELRRVFTKNSQKLNWAELFLGNREPTGEFSIFLRIFGHFHWSCFQRRNSFI